MELVNDTLLAACIGLASRRLNTRSYGAIMEEAKTLYKYAMEMRAELQEEAEKARARGA